MSYQRFEEQSICQAIHDLGLWLIPHVGKWPKWIRPTCGQQTLDCLLRVFRFCVSAYAAPKQQRLHNLQQASVELDGLRLLLRLSVSLHLTSVKQFEHVSGLVGEVGRQLGGWIGSAKKDEGDKCSS
jgi:hypothetical protein